MSQLLINPIKAFSDNYIWAIECEYSNDIAVVDPGDAEPVFNYLQQHDKQLTAILVTHHHFDHVGGIDQLLTSYPDTIVYGPANCNYPSIAVELKHGDHCTIHDSQFSVMEVPGHTLDHIAYHSVEDGVLFCGDTLFAGGCGRVFEGTHEQMFKSLALLKQLPKHTNCYCAHEYTMANLAFALSVEPDNQALIDRQLYCSEMRAQDIPTIPFTIDDELLTNPFLLVYNSAGFSERRTLKDNF